MDRRDYLRLLAAGAATGAMTTTAVGQESPTATPTSTATDDESDPADVVEQEPTYLAQVDPTTRVLSYDVDDPEDGDGTAKVSVKLETDAPTIVTMADPFGGLVQEGVTSVETKETSIPRGEVRVSMQTTTWEEESTALGLATPRGQVVISTGLPDDDAPETNLWTGVGSGVTAMGLGTGLAAWRRTANQKDEPEDAVKDKRGLFNR